MLGGKVKFFSNLLLSCCLLPPQKMAFTQNFFSFGLFHLCVPQKHLQCLLLSSRISCLQNIQKLCNWYFWKNFIFFERKFSTQTSLEETHKNFLHNSLILSFSPSNLICVTTFKSLSVKSLTDSLSFIFTALNSLLKFSPWFFLFF